MGRTRGGSMELTRRGLLAAFGSPLAAQVAPSSATEWRRYADPVTEFEVIRLTDPQWECRLPPLSGRAIDRRSRMLLYASNRGGSWQPWLMDLSSKLSEPLGSFQEFQPGALALSGDDKEVWLLDGRSILAVQSKSPTRRRELARLRDGWNLAGAWAGSDDSTHLFFAEQRDAASEVRRVRLPKGMPETVIEQPGTIGEIQPNPRRATLAWLSGDGELWAAAYDGTAKRKLETPPGRVLETEWAPDGQSLYYLLAPAGPGKLNEIREQQLDTRADALVARTSQFVSFGRNANASVFVGASQSKASPTVLVLLRATRREFTLCEHKSTDPARVAPRFTPNSQRIIFESDRHGKPALYLLNVERLIEKTDS
ncbi:MAG: PD40 domain-containing protein [Acidobacteria bacterium]|nr:PD40 domain-containing protein [Acidobacteriota bacterium]